MGRNFPQLRSTLSAWFAIGKLGFERLCPKPDQSRHVDPELEWRLHTRSTPLVFPLTIFRQQTPETSATRGRSDRFSIPHPQSHGRRRNLRRPTSYEIRSRSQRGPGLASWQFLAVFKELVGC